MNVHSVALRFTRYSRATMHAIEIGIFAASCIMAFLSRFDFILPASYRPHLAVGLLVWVPIKVVVFHLFKLDRGWWRYVSIGDVARIGFANFAGSALGTALLLVFAPRGFPRSIYLLDFVLCFGMTAGVRLSARMAFEFSRIPQLIRRRALIYGAGDAGVSLLRETHRNSGLSYEVVGFVDDDPAKSGTVIDNTRVLGTGEKLASIVAARDVETILIALPSATGAQMTSVLKLCQSAGVSYKTVPSLAQIIEGQTLGQQVRDVAVDDLLGRSPARLEHREISAKLSGVAVLITGAAGSIGSELCRQIARFQPRAIVGFDISETALFHLEREMKQSFADVVFHAEIGSIQNPRRLAEVFRKYRPSIVYHAAAYKHVPMMEAHVFEAIENNVFGTWNLANAACESGVQDFVMISSDKAVRPTNIMGATKRVAEILIRAMQGSGPNFVSVRFGNVLGSNGSVIPIFKQQIAAGGPVTVTHPEMRRFFMTIPEASQLVLQASTMGRGGEIFVLDMGEPVRIVDLARNLILLSGLRPDEDIRIEFSGIRPGEKLYEELSLDDEYVVETHHEKIRIFAGNGMLGGMVRTQLAEMRRICERRDLGALLAVLQELVPDYRPSAGIVERAAGGSQTVHAAGSLIALAEGTGFEDRNLGSSLRA